MPQFTYLSQEEIDRGRTYDGDAEISGLLREVRRRTGDDLIVRSWISRTFSESFFRRRLREIKAEERIYLAKVIGRGPEVQILGDSHGVSGVRAWLYGILNGLDAAEKIAKESKRDPREESVR